uniref:D-aminoacyl-tRNA deacylase n=1 Tax=Tetraodon nigroviridis TaxID=99883 RepID=H3C552_TETNG
MSEKERALAARTVLQQCLRARLQVRPAGERSEAEFVQVRMDRGTVLYICFFKGATDDILPKMAVHHLLNLADCAKHDSGKLSSLLELPGSLLIVPQATLGGEARGRDVQYHTDISKEDGLRLHSAFVSLRQQEVAKAGPTVRHGSYGNRQVLSLDTNGPFTHPMEF